MIKYTLVHAGNRDDYKVAEALFESGRLSKLITDDYTLRKDAPFLKKLVKTIYSALITNAFIRLFKTRSLNSIKDKLLSVAAFNEAKRSDSGLFCYSYYAAEAFSKGFTGVKILFQLHPHPKTVRQIFLTEISKNPLAKSSLFKEHELNLSVRAFNRMVTEPQLSDYIITASNFTKQSLIENGISESKIHIIPYGINLESFKERPNYTRVPSCLKVIFVGSINQRKGVSYLSQACKFLQDKGLNIHLKVIGRGIIDKQLIDEYHLNNVQVRIDISQEELINEYNSADVFVFPSLCEGFGHVILEAMATGLPVLTTSNTAGPDIITDGRDGFIIPVADSVAIAEKLETLYYDCDKNISMGVSASVTARKFSWDCFKINLNDFLTQIKHD